MKNASLSIFSSPENEQNKNIFVSDYLPSAKEDLDIIKLQIHRTNQSIKTVSALTGYEMNAKAVENSRQIAGEEILDRLKDFNHITESILLKLINLATKKYQSGNCNEFAFFCYELLKSKKIKCELFNLTGGDHVFLVINRDLSTSVSDFRNWNQEAFIVDPLFSSIYASHEIPTYLKSCTYDVITNKISYISFDENTHTLSNNVLKNLIEDWNTVINCYKAKNSCGIKQTQ